MKITGDYDDHKLLGVPARLCACVCARVCVPRCESATDQAQYKGLFFRNMTCVTVKGRNDYFLHVSVR